MNFFTDDYFQIGTAHLKSGKPCQDYAMSGIQEKMAFAIVADGCSSGDRTDIGSRILNLSTATALRQHWLTTRQLDVKNTPAIIDIQQKIVVGGIKNTLDLTTNDMLATCVYAVVSPAGGIIHVQGDGVVAIKYRDGKIWMSNFEWEGNKPFYPVYQNGRLPGFIKAQGNDLKKKCLRQEIWQLESAEELFPLDVKEFTLEEGIKGITVPITPEDLKEKIEFITVFSDGIAQVDKTDWKEAVENFMAFKNTMGVFAKRRMIRGIKDSQKVGQGPVDDISYAVIRVEANVEEEDNEN
jgi:hypothetical protein